MNAAESNFLKLMLKREVRQGFSHQANIIELYKMIREAAEAEFNEDNEATLRSFLTGCFDKAYPSKHPPLKETMKPKTKVDFARLCAKAHAEGMKAGLAVGPSTMYISDGSLTYAVPDGPCGFAWVLVRPSNSGLAKYLREQWRARQAYKGGTQLSVFEFGQSMIRKEAYATAMAKVFSEAGYQATPESRMD